MKKKKIHIIANWKMNPQTAEEAKTLFSKTNKSAEKSKKVSVLCAVPYVYVGKLTSGTKKVAKIGVQDVSSEASGSYTGSISADMAKNVGASFTIIGHCEKRKGGDTDEMISKKVALANTAGLSVVLCVGEGDRDTNGGYLDGIKNQLVVGLSAFPKESIKTLVIAYEPVWAIGKSFKDAMKPDQIHEMCIYIKKVLTQIFGRESAELVPVLYGGSVDFENSQAILSDGEVGGLLIGRQSLDATAFSNIIGYANKL